jgi:gliding motility-associated-like protein
LASYQWLESGNPIGGKTQSSLNVFQSGVYSVKVSNGACFATSKDTIVNQFSPVADISFSNIPTLVVRDVNTTIDSLAFCETDTITLSGPIPSMPMTTIGYQWIRDSIGLFSQAFPRALPGATKFSYKTARSGAYRLVTLWNPGGCPDTSGYMWLFADTIHDVFVMNKPWPGLGTPSLSICPNDSTLLSASAQSASGIWGYQWQVRYPITGNWQNIPNDTLATLKVSTKLVPGTAQYRLLIEGEACDYTTAAVQVTVVPFPTVATVPADSTFICFGDSTQLAVIGNALSYSWNNGTIWNTSFYASASGNYVVEGIGPNGCASYDTVKVKLFTVNANAGPDLLVLPGEVVQLNATGGVMYYWYADKPVYFSDPYNPNAQTQPTQDTTYYYVDVMSAEGCFDRDTLMVVQFDPTSVLVDLSNVQNFLSPNGDNKNDILDLSEVMRLDSCGITILNRWGATVYTEARYTNGWTGTNNAGDALPDGTYYIILTKDQEVRYRGAVTLVR